MKLDRHGIKFNIWLNFLLFTAAIIAMFGILQFSLIRPYYRNSKIQSVKQVVNQIEELIILENGNEDASMKAFQAAIDNNVCAAVYNSNGKLVYRADSLGSGCVFFTPLKGEYTFLNSGMAMKQLLDGHDGEYSMNMTNPTTGQEMVVYGRRVQENLATFYLFVNSPLEPVDSIISFFSKQYILYMIIVLILASVLSMFISDRLTVPIVKMKKEADKLAAADYTASFDGAPFTETKELASTLNSANEKLGQIDELRKDLIANVSHDIKTPLTSIKAYAEMIRDFSGEIPKKREEHLNIIMNEVDYLDHLVMDMSELSRFQSGTYLLKKRNFDLAGKIKDVISLEQVMIEEGKITVHCEVPETLTVFADEIKITQVIYNFLSNAIKHTPQNGLIFVRARLLKDEETVRVEIEDTGEGIDEAQIPYIWQRYQKSSRSFSRSMTSTGLGLSIVKAILDAHEAHYGVKSEVGKGSLFWFEIQRPEEPEEMEDD